MVEKFFGRRVEAARSNDKFGRPVSPKTEIERAKIEKNRKAGNDGRVQSGNKSGTRK